MAGLRECVAVILYIGMTSSQYVEPPYFYPMEHRAPSSYSGIQPNSQPVPVQSIEQLPPSSLYSYQIVPRDEYAVDIAQSTELGIWDYIPSPLTALTFVGKTAVAIGQWVLIKAPIILLGVAMTVGFCAFTPYCTLAVSKPMYEKYSQALKNVPYLDEIEDYFSGAIDKFQSLNEVKKK